MELNKGPVFGIRHIQFCLMFTLGLLLYSTRFAFSVAIVAMTERKSPNPDVPFYDWPNKSFILSTFFWGYIIPQIPIGILGTKFGTKQFILTAVIINSLCMVCIPTIAQYGSQGVMICRIIQGFAQGLVVPSCHGLLGKWAPHDERSRAYGVVSTGYTLGLVIGLSSTGIMCASWIGWPLSFYLLPSVGFVWALVYFFYGATSPATHKTISEVERKYIQISLESQDIRNVRIPFRGIFTSIPFGAQMTMALCSGWGFSIFTTEIPIYMDKVMKYDISSNGLVSALPQVFTLISTALVGIVADSLIGKYLSIGTTRKLMSCLGSVGAAILLLILVFLTDDAKTFTIVIFISASSFRALNIGGWNVNHLDLAPNFGSTLMGFLNTSAEIFSVITPIAIQYIVYDEADRHLWNIIFLTAVCLYLISTIVYVCFASGEIQPWNSAPTETRDKRPHLNKQTDAEKVLLS